MSPAILIVVGILFLWLVATGRAAAVIKAALGKT